MMFVLEDRVLRDLLRARPGIEFSQPEQKRNKEESHPRDRSRARLEKAPHRKAPATAGEIVQHEHLQASQRQAQPKEIGEQVRGEEFTPSERKAAKTNREAYNAREQGGQLNAVQ